MKFLIGFALACVCLVPIWAEDVLEGRKYALLVGVQYYQGSDLSNLKYCENDVEALADILRGDGFRYNRVVVLTRRAALKDQDRDDILPTAENIRTRLTGMLKDLRPRDTVLVAFAGHGLQMKADGKMYFCPAKCNLNKLDTLISMDDIYAVLRDCNALNKVLLVDACRNDPMAVRDAKPDQRVISLTLPLLPDPPGGTVAMFSCSKGQVARESDKHAHGYMFKYLIEGLKGNVQVANKSGEIGWLKLAAFVADEVRDKVKDDFGDQIEQTPEVKGESRNMVLGRLVSVQRPAVFPLWDGVESMADYARRNGLQATRSIDLGKGQSIKLALVPAGQFTMGSLAGEKDHQPDETQHEVRLTRPFYVATTHVTVAQFRVFVDETGYKTDAEKEGTGWGLKADGKYGPVAGIDWKNPGIPQGENHPVVQISWNDAQGYLSWLRGKSGKSVRLPTEAEFEFANRAGTQTAFQWGNSPDDGKGWANCFDKSAKTKFPNFTEFSWDDGYVYTSPAGSFNPNNFGLYDMNGNALNWCEDKYAAKYYEGRPNPDVNPGGPSTGDEGTSPFDGKKYEARVLRGGSWGYNPGYCRSAYRFNYAPGSRISFIGFRVVVSGLD